MKPLSELRDKWERQSNAPTPTDEFQAANFHFDRGRQYCADELQAWLREADRELSKPDNEYPREGIKPSTIAKLLRLGAIKGKKKRGRNEQFFITPAGRNALKPAPSPTPAGKPREEG